MKKQIIKIDENFIKAGVQAGECPLNWLASYYHEYKGKLVMLDDNALLYLLNHSQHDRVILKKEDNVNIFALMWNATEESPETEVIVSSYGRATVIECEDGTFDIVPRDMNWNIIEVLEAEDIIESRHIYAENMIADKQKVFLVTHELEQENELILTPRCKEEESEL